MTDKIEIKQDKTFDKKFNVEYAYIESPLDVQQAIFDSKGLKLVSPSEKAYMEFNQEKNHHFLNYSRTNMDVLYRPKEKDIVLVKGGFLGNRYIKDLVDAHRKNKEFEIPKNDKEFVYLVNMMLNEGSAMSVSPSETLVVNTKDFGNNEITDFLFSDDTLNFKAEDYGRFLNDKFGRESINLYFPSQEYIAQQNNDFLNKVRVGGSGSFDIGNDDWDLDGNSGAFGVRFEFAEGEPQKRLYSIKELRTAKNITEKVMHGKEANSKLNKVLYFLDNKLQ